MSERFDEFRRKAKLRFEDARYKAERVKEGVAKWARENPSEAASVVGTAIFGGLTVGYGAVSKAKKKRDEFNERETRQWDPVTGQYYYTKRAMKNNEKLELDRRMKNGESKGEVLRDMRLL